MVFVEGQVGAGSSLGTTLRHGSRGGSAGNGVGWSGGGFAGRGHDGVQSFGQVSESATTKASDIASPRREPHAPDVCKANI
jgi:hypothetical protein